MGEGGLFVDIRKASSYLKRLGASDSVHWQNNISFSEYNGCHLTSKSCIFEMCSYVYSVCVIFC